MCLSFVVRDRIPDLPLLLLFNRDETYARPAEPLHRWPDETPAIFAGRDGEMGGTWAGTNAEGYFAMLLFVREPRREVTHSRRRGEIVPDFLRRKSEPDAFVHEMSSRANEYLHFNLIAGRVGNVLHYSNRTDEATPLGHGVHGISNGDLGEPWFKVLRGTEAIERQLESAPLDFEGYFRILNDREEAPPEEVQHTGLPFDYERIRSPLFVMTPTYGTRTSTVVAFRRSGEVLLEERSYDSGGRRFHTVRMAVGVGKDA
ncbi:MAG: NRDE family protein [Bdellovibrionota bacterium]